MAGRTHGALALSDENPEDDDLATSHLAGAALESGGQSANIATSEAGHPESIDWVARLRAATHALTTELDEEEPVEQTAPVGMRQHETAPRVSLTRGARIAANLKRSTLMLVLALASAGILAAGAYALATTSWISTLFTSPAPVPPTSRPVQSKPPAPPQTSPANPGDVITTGPETGASATQLSNRALEQYRLGNYDQAIKLLETSVNYDNTDAMAFYRLGMAYLAVSGREHSAEDAEMAFRTAISLQPSWAAPYQMLAESLLRRGFYSQAIAPAEKATQLNATQPENWLTLGRAYRGAGRSADATRAAAQAARLAPAPPEP